jgi:polar amino acid transport system substrate-binding protein
MDFSDIYYEGGQSLVTVKANAASITSFEDINSPDFTVGAQTGSIQLDLANANTPNANIVSMPKVTDIISELLSGKEYAAFIETDVAKSYQKNYPDLEIVMDVPYEAEGSAIGVSKGNAALLAKVNEAIAAAKADGSLETFVAEANEKASGTKYEGLLDENGQAPAEEAAEASASAQ